MILTFISPWRAARDKKKKQRRDQTQCCFIIFLQLLIIVLFHTTGGSDEGQDWEEPTKVGGVKTIRPSDLHAHAQLHIKK